MHELGEEADLQRSRGLRPKPASIEAPAEHRVDWNPDQQASSSYHSFEPLNTLQRRVLNSDRYRTKWRGAINYGRVYIFREPFTADRALAAIKVGIHWQ